MVLVAAAVVAISLTSDDSSPDAVDGTVRTALQDTEPIADQAFPGYFGESQFTWVFESIRYSAIIDLRGEEGDMTVSYTILGELRTVK